MNQQTLTPEIDRFMEVFGGKAELHPELKKHLVTDPRFGTMLRHPLVQHVFYHDALANYANKAYEHKSELLRKLDEDGEFDRAVFLHERPWRLNALIERVHRIPVVEKGRLVGEVWRDSEQPHVNLQAWRTLWLDPGVAAHAMDEEERALFAVLQRKATEGTLTLWRGTSMIEAAARGLSWTTDYDKAVWFARREGRGMAVVWEVKPPADRLFAYMDGRGEREVILNAKGLRGIRRARRGGAL